MGRVKFFDVLKGLCSIIIIFTHCAWTTAERSAAFFPFWVDTAVPIFMMISGYVYAASIEKSKLKKAEDALSLSFTYKKLVRYSLPFIFAFLAEIIIHYILGGTYTKKELFINFFQGGFGPGSYYIPIMIQFIFIFRSKGAQKRDCSTLCFSIQFTKLLKRHMN